MKLTLATHKMRTLFAKPRLLVALALSMLIFLVAGATLSLAGGYGKWGPDGVDLLAPCGGSWYIRDIQTVSDGAGGHSSHGWIYGVVCTI